MGEHQLKRIVSAYATIAPGFNTCRRTRSLLSFKAGQFPCFQPTRLLPAPHLTSYYLEHRLQGNAHVQSLGPPIPLVGCSTRALVLPHLCPTLLCVSWQQPADTEPLVTLIMKGKRKPTTLQCQWRMQTDKSCQTQPKINV